MIFSKIDDVMQYMGEIIEFPVRLSTVFFEEIKKVLKKFKIF